MKKTDQYRKFDAGFKHTSRNSLSYLYQKKERAESPFNIYNDSFNQNHKLTRVNYFRNLEPNETRKHEEFMRQDRQSKEMVERMKTEVFNSSRRDVFTPDLKTCSTRKDTNLLLSPKFLIEDKLKGVKSKATRSALFPNDCHQ